MVKMNDKKIIVYGLSIISAFKAKLIPPSAKFSELSGSRENGSMPSPQNKITNHKATEDIAISAKEAHQESPEYLRIYQALLTSTEFHFEYTARNR